MSSVIFYNYHMVYMHFWVQFSVSNVDSIHILLWVLSNSCSQERFKINSILTWQLKRLCAPLKDAILSRLFLWCVCWPANCQVWHSPDQPVRSVGCSCETMPFIATPFLMHACNQWDSMLYKVERMEIISCAIFSPGRDLASRCTQTKRSIIQLSLMN